VESKLQQTVSRVGEGTKDQLDPHDHHNLQERHARRQVNRQPSIPQRLIETLLIEILLIVHLQIHDVPQTDRRRTRESLLIILQTHQDGLHRQENHPRQQVQLHPLTDHLPHQEG